MKHLYYSTAYYADHGGSIQSIEFFKNLEDQKGVENVKIFPTTKNFINTQLRSQDHFRSSLKKIPLVQVLFFYRRNRKHLIEIEGFINEYRPDVVILQIDSNFLQIDYLKSKFPEILIATQVNASPFDEPFKNISFKKFFQQKQRDMYAKSDLNIFISSFLRERVMGDNLNIDRDVVVHNGTDTSKFYPISDTEKLRDKHNYPQSKILIGYIGTLDFHKKLGLLLKAFIPVSKMYTNAQLIIIGHGPAVEDLKDSIRELGLIENVTLKGWVNHDEMNEHLNCFDIAIHHHANDYMSPLKIFEYLASGLPVIAPNIPAVREIFVEDKDLVFTNATEEDISENICSLIMDEEKRRYLEEIGPKIIKERLTWQSYTKKIVEELINFRNK